MLIFSSGAEVNAKFEIREFSFWEDQPSDLLANEAMARM